MDLPDVFTFGSCSTPISSTQTKMATPTQHQSGTGQGNQNLDHSYPSTMFNFISDASMDVITTKLSSALMLPALQQKFRESFVCVAKEALKDILQEVVAPLKQEIQELRGKVQLKTDELEQ